ncbi:hypothetical protein RRG08_063988 [Elysia crispata]|uniref:Uncharacterized protein n=1 Tax=Elysia crispata TaxID=231223 RepID=A0AAE0YEV3_9GAST|nr:hypothetical protein RRG08_063988 [Elysia crispata]
MSEAPFSLFRESFRSLKQKHRFQRALLAELGNCKSIPDTEFKSPGCRKEVAPRLFLVVTFRYSTSHQTCTPPSGSLADSLLLTPTGAAGVGGIQ